MKKKRAVDNFGTFLDDIRQRERQQPKNGVASSEQKVRIRQVVVEGLAIPLKFGNSIPTAYRLPRVRRTQSGA